MTVAWAVLALVASFVVLPSSARAITAHGPTSSSSTSTSSTSTTSSSSTTSTSTSTTSTTVRPTTTTTRPQQHPNRSRTGYATWYRWRPGQCAAAGLRWGTMLKVTAISSHRVVWCKVTDSQPYSKTRVVDLSTTGFQKLAPLGVGMVRVTVTW